MVSSSLWSLLATAYVLVLAPAVHSVLSGSSRNCATQYWDYIIVGGGTAGSVVATRLSESPHTRVLVLEAGDLDSGTDASVLNVPFLVAGAGPNTRFDWNYTTVPQPFASNRTLSYPRGHVLGGSSSTNYMAYTRGSFEEYDRIASLTGDKRWSWENMLKMLLRNEQHVASADGHDTTGQYDPAYHGDGSLLTSLPGNPSDIDHRVLNTSRELGQEYNYIKEMNSGETLGIGWLQSTIGNSVRSSASTAFLDPAAQSRSNLVVLTNVHVTRLLTTSGYKNARFNKVQFYDKTANQYFTVKANREVILSAGSIGTPTILKLSGIGPKGELRRHGIKPIVSSPNVGKNLQDHPYVTFQWLVNSTSTFDELARNQTAFLNALQYYQKTGKGTMANNAVANHIGFFRVPESSSLLRKYGDPAAGKSSPHYEFAFSNGFIGTEQPLPETGNYFSVAAVITSPTARGGVQLRSADPFDPPLIDPGFLSTASDRAIAVEAYRSIERFLQGSAWKGYLISPYGDVGGLRSDQSIEAYWQKWLTSIRHPVSTAALSSWDDDSGVVNPDLTVKNVSGLRIIDASVLPWVPAAHPVAMVYAVAELGAQLIRG